MEYGLQLYSVRDLSQNDLDGALGFQMVVESESLNPDGITEAQICFEYLQSL